MFIRESAKVQAFFMRNGTIHIVFKAILSAICRKHKISRWNRRPLETFQIRLFTLLYPPEYSPMVFQLGRIYYAPSLRKYRKITQTFGSVVGGKSVRQENVSGGTHFPRKFCPTGQDILSTLGQIIRVCF